MDVDDKNVLVTPVALPSGRLRLATRPISTGSPPLRNTIGMVEVAARAARMETFGPTITATCRCARSAASAGSRSSLFSAQRNSIATLWPSMNPASFRPSRNDKLNRQPSWCYGNRSPASPPAAPEPPPAMRRRAAEQPDELAPSQVEHGLPLRSRSAARSAYHRPAGRSLRA